jgi:cytochrome c
MKYLLPLIISLVFSACNDSSATKITNSFNEENITSQESKTQTLTVPQTNNSTVITQADQTEMSGETIFSKCKSCHGSNAEKSALGASKIIKGWNVSKIETALKGYQAGTYGGSMKNVMAAQAKGLSDDEITKVATYIHSL